IKNEFNRHQHNDDIAPGKHANHTEQEQSGAENQIMQRRNIEHCMHINSENLVRLKSNPSCGTHNSQLVQILFFAITTAPIIATSNNRDAISKANIYVPVARSNSRAATR